MTSSPSQAPAAGKSPSTVPDGLALFRHWLETEGAKGWDALDTAPDSGYEKVWRAWLRRLGDVGMSAKEDPPPPPPPKRQNKSEAPPPQHGTPPQMQKILPPPDGPERENR